MTTSTTNRPKLSIIVPCYNVAAYLPKCLASLVGQTLQDIEAICINDGSKDESLEILKEWQARYPDKIVIIDKQNEGVWRGRWDGIAKARGEYIGFLDSDDYAEPDFAEKLYTAAKEADADISVCGFSRIDLDTEKTLSREMCKPRSPFVIAEDPGRMLELNGAPWNKCIRAEILKEMHDLTEPPPVLDDLMFLLLAYLKSQGKVVFVPHSLINYMVRAGSIINSVSEEQINAVYRAFAEVRSLYEQEGVSKATLDALDAVAFLHIGISFNYRLSCDPKCDTKKTFDRSREYLDTNFPGWRDSPYINAKYAHANGEAYRKVLISYHMFTKGLMSPFLKTYQFVIDKLHIDIKW